MADVPISDALIDSAQFQIQSVTPPTPASGLVRLFRGVSQWQEKREDGSVTDVGGGGTGPLFYMSGLITAPAVSSGGASVECDLFAGLLVQNGALAVIGSADIHLPLDGVYLVFFTLIVPASTGNCLYIISSSGAADLNYDDDVNLFSLEESGIGSKSLTGMTTVTATAGQTVGLSVQRTIPGTTGEPVDVGVRLYVQKL